MRYRVVVQPRAEQDVATIFDWIAKQSPTGANRWFDEWLRTVKSLSDDPLRFSLAPESNWASGEVRQAIFRTRRGKRYRALFYVDAQTVHVIHVRGSGQDLLPRSGGAAPSS